MLRPPVVLQPACAEWTHFTKGVYPLNFTHRYAGAQLRRLTNLTCLQPLEATDVGVQRLDDELLAQHTREGRACVGGECRHAGLAVPPRHTASLQPFVIQPVCYSPFALELR